MSEIIECPICMDTIESTTRNCVATECGHCFHTNCLMTSVAHNGFGCPYCRTEMAKEVAEDEESEYDDEESEYEDEQYDDYALRGMRFFNNIVNGEEHDQADLDEEDLDEEEDAVNEDAEEVDATQLPPSVSYVAQKLTEQGITIEDLLKVILSACHNYERDFEDFERVENEVVGRVNTILKNYTPSV